MEGWEGVGWAEGKAGRRAQEEGECEEEKRGKEEGGGEQESWTWLGSKALQLRVCSMDGDRQPSPSRPLPCA